MSEAIKLQTHKPSLNGHRPRKMKPRLVQGKTIGRVRKAVADSYARQNRPVNANRIKIRVREDWDDIPHSAVMNVPDELIPHTPYEPSQSVVRPMPRRSQSKSDITGEYMQSQMTLPERPKVSMFKTLRRFGVWVGAYMAFQRGTFWDRMRGIDSEERRAIRLRETFETVGGTFVKIGQQMSSRLDLLPVRYCQELANMLDNFPPFPAEQAIAIIERSTGRPLGETFSAFDPEPIGSASIACVFQATLRDGGAKVAVKVRRPGIRYLFEQDFRVIDLLGTLVESLTLVRPGFTEDLRAEFREVLSAELDFRREARLCELFERGSRKLKNDYFTAPKIYFDYSSEEVLVQEFVTGMWLWELLGAVERRDPPALARMKQLNLDPTEVARRLIYANNWGLLEHLAFHADPHPANIVVQANNKLVFIDFGACGYINNVRRAILARTYESFLNEDPYAMAQCSMAMLEPLPPMDVNAISKATEKAFHDQILAMKSKHSPWYERTSANMFISSINITSRFNLATPPRDYLTLARATLLYDTLCARLDPDFNFYKEYKRFRKEAQRKARRRGRKAMRERLRKGLSASDYQTLGELAKTGGDLLFRAQRLLNVPYDFAVLPYTVEKWTFTAIMLIRFFIRAVLVTVLGVGVAAAVRLANEQAIVLSELVQQVITHPVYALVMVVLVLMHIRLIMFRLNDKVRKE